MNNQSVKHAGLHRAYDVFYTFKTVFEAVSFSLEQLAEHGDAIAKAYRSSILTFDSSYLTLVTAEHVLLYPGHLWRGVYSFRVSVRLFVRSYVRSLVRSFVIPSHSWNYFKVLR